MVFPEHSESDEVLTHCFAQRDILMELSKLLKSPQVSLASIERFVKQNLEQIEKDLKTWV